MTPSAEQRQVLTFDEVAAAGLTDWRQLFEALRTRFITGGFNRGWSWSPGSPPSPTGPTTIPMSTFATRMST
jgi:hypothetical protein